MEGGDGTTHTSGLLGFTEEGGCWIKHQRVLDGVRVCVGGVSAALHIFCLLGSFACGVARTVLWRLATKAAWKTLLIPTKPLSIYSSGGGSGAARWSLFGLR